MAHWAELNENNIVLRVTVGDNNDPNGDEGYQWLIDNLGGRWLKTSYNTANGQHLLSGVPFRGNYAGVGGSYHEDIDVFMPPKEYPSWIIDTTNYTWMPPMPQPDSGFWIWDEDTVSWKEKEPR
jgi:hypothetical protein